MPSTPRPPGVALSLSFTSRRAFTVSLELPHQRPSIQSWQTRSLHSNGPTVYSLRLRDGSQAYINNPILCPNRQTPQSHYHLQPQRSITQSHQRSFTAIHERFRSKVRLSVLTQSHQKLHQSTMAPITPIRSNPHENVDSDSSPDHSGASSNTSANTSPSRTPGEFQNLLAKYDLTEDTLHKVEDVFIELAEQAGIIMVNAEHDVLAQAGSKNNTSDLVSAYDKGIEAIVKARLEKEFPDFAFLGEETHKAGQKLVEGPTFIVDPIDGTLNFTRGFHNHAISLSLALEKKPIVGLVYSPNLGKLFTGIKTHGSFLVNELFVSRRKVVDPLERKNKDPVITDFFGKLAVTPAGQASAPVTPMELSQQQGGENFVPTFKAKLAKLSKYKLPLTPIPPPMPGLKRRLIAIEWGNERKGPNWDLRLDVHNKLLTHDDAGGEMILSCRSSGSAALDFCYVAAGMFDAFWEGGVWVWDVAAGWLIVEEAGGIVASANPGDWEPTLEGRTYFPVRGAKREDQEAVVNQLWDVMGNRKFVYPAKK